MVGQGKWLDLPQELRDELRAGRERNRLLRREEAAWRREQRTELAPRRLKALSRVPVATRDRLLEIRRLWHALRTMQGFRPQGRLRVHARPLTPCGDR